MSRNIRLKLEVGGWAINGGEWRIDGDALERGWKIGEVIDGWLRIGGGAVEGGLRV